MGWHRSVVVAGLIALFPAELLAQATPYTSYRKLSSANGFAPIVFDLERRRVVSFRENMYRFPEPGAETRELAFDLYLGLAAGGGSGWLTERPLLEAGYEVGTGLIRTVQEADGLRVTTTYTAPWGLRERAMLVVAEVEPIAGDVSNAALFSLHNFHVGGGPDATGDERIVWTPALGAYVESSAAIDAAQGVLVAKPLTPATRHTASPANPYPIVNEGRRFADLDDSGVISDAVSGFQWDLPSPLGAGQTASFAMVVAWAPDGDAAGLVRRIESYHGGRSPEALLEAERADWQSWRQAGLLPNTSSDDELQVSLQSLAVLRMGQVHEPGGPNGQILASLAPGQWDIAWLRDGMLAVRGLTATGHHQEAEAALDFFIRGPFGDYRSYLGRDYGLTVARHYGNAREESDWNGNGPNVELDGFGMYLEAAAGHVDASGDSAWLLANRDHVDRLVADVLVEVRDPATDLVAADSSIWESHWDNGGRQRWVFTSGMAVLGLTRWADALATHAGDQAKAAGYRAAAASILAAMQQHLVDPGTGALASSVEQLSAGDGAFADAQAAMILGPATFAPSSATGIATLDLLGQRLFLGASTGRGYKRNDDGDTYDEREWVVIDLAMAMALRRAGRTAPADALQTWITGQAAQNFLLVPELLDQDDARYLGEVPMIGFGAGAYLLALIDRSGTRSAVPAPTDAGFAPDAASAADAGGALDAEAPDAARGFDAAQTPDAGAADATPNGDARVRAGPVPPAADTSCDCNAAPVQHAGDRWQVALLLLAALALGRRKVAPPALPPYIKTRCPIPSGSATRSI